MIDTHAHLNIEEFDHDLDQVIERSKQVGIKQIIVIGMNPESNLKALSLLKHAMLYATIGIHPSYVDEVALDEDIESLLKHPKVVAIGECGIDLYWRRDNIERQKEWFLKQIKLAIKTKLPLVIHNRNAFDEIYEMLKPYKGKIEGVFHCFSEDTEALKKVLDLGFYIGIDGPITFKKNEGLVEVLKSVPMDRVLIETDAPYLAPVPFRGKRNEPSYVKYVAEKIAEIRQMELQVVQHITTANAKQLFKKLGEVNEKN